VELLLVHSSLPGAGALDRIERLQLNLPGKVDPRVVAVVEALNIIATSLHHLFSSQ
jgi:hypothetical protein